MKARILLRSFLVFLVLTAISAGPALSGKAEGSEREHQGKPRGAWSGRQVDRFRVLTGSRHPLPGRLRSPVEDALGRHAASLRFDQAVPVRTAYGRIWMISGKGFACIVRERGGALACSATHALLVKGLAIGAFNPPKRPGGRPTAFLVLGVAPDWAKWALLSVNGRTRRIPIRHNAYSLKADRPIAVKGFRRG